MPLKTDKEYIDRILASFPMVFAFLLPISQKLSTICMALWGIMTLLTYKKTLIQKNKAYVFPALYYGLVVISVFFSETFNAHFLEHKFAFLLLPLLFFLRAGRISYPQKKTLHYFVYGCFFAIGICLFVAFYRSLGIESGKIVFNPRIKEGFSFYNSIIYGGNYFFGTTFSILHQTVYFSMYLVAALIILVNYPFRNFTHTLFCSLFLVLVIGMVMNRASYIALLVISLFYLFFKIKSNFKRIVLSGIIVLCGLILYRSDPRIKRMQKNVETYIDAEEGIERAILLNNIDRRLLIWYTAAQVALEHLSIGVGITNVRTVLNERYSKYNTEALADLNAHNQYLQTLLEFGIIGLLLVLFLIINIWRIGKSYYSKSFVLCFLLLLMINFIFESVLNRYSGLSFVIFFYCLFVTKPRQEMKALGSENLSNRIYA